MSRLFDDASAQYLERTTAVLSAFPVTMACWFYSDNTTDQQNLMAISKADDANGWIRLLLRYDFGGIGAQFKDYAGSAQGAYTAANYSANTWTHACAVFATEDSIKVYINGGNAGTSTNDMQAWNMAVNRTSIGRLNMDSTPIQYMSGRIAEAGIWSAALSDAEVLNLASDKYAPPLVQNANLVAYWKLAGDASPEPDDKNDYDLTVSGATQAGHVPDMVYTLGSTVAPLHLLRTQQLGAFAL